MLRVVNNFGSINRRSFLPEFQMTEKKLEFGSIYFKNITMLTKGIDISQYENLLEFIFIEIFPLWDKYRIMCYNGSGPVLEDCPFASDQLIQSFDVFLSEFVLELVNYEKEISWESVKKYSKCMILQQYEEIPIDPFWAHKKHQFSLNERS